MVSLYALPLVRDNALPLSQSVVLDAPSSLCFVLSLCISIQCLSFSWIHHSKLWHINHRHYRWEWSITVGHLIPSRGQSFLLYYPVLFTGYLKWFKKWRFPLFPYYAISFPMEFILLWYSNQLLTSKPFLDTCKIA